MRPRNLDVAQSVGMGAPDVTLTGAVTGAVRGSLVVDDDGQGIRFLKTGGELAPDTYTVRLSSRSDGFIDTVGGLLDGNGDGTPGDDHEVEYTVVAGNAPILSIGDFARGPGQAVELGTSSSLPIPIRLSDGVGVTSLSFTLRYDPSLLTITAVDAGSALTGASVQSSIDAAQGVVEVTVAAAAGLSAGTVDVVTLAAVVPTDALYGAKHVLDLGDVLINGVGARDNDGLHLVAYFGDTSGDGTDLVYTTLDVQRLQRVSVRLDSGFGAYPNVDPRIVGDITGNGVFSAIDTTRLLQEVNYVRPVGTASNRPEIPDLPATRPTVYAGPDPVVAIGAQFSATRGDVVSVPVTLDNASGLESARLRIGFDPTRLDVVDVRRGTLAGDFGWYVVGNEPGVVYVDMSRLNPMAGGQGSLVMVDFRIRSDAVAGITALDLHAVILNDGRMVLSPLPEVGADATDGAIDIAVPVVEAPRRGLLSALGDSLRRLVTSAAAVSGQPQEQRAAEILVAGMVRLTPATNASDAVVQLVGAASSSTSTSGQSSASAASFGQKWLSSFVGGTAQANPNDGLKISVSPDAAPKVSPSVAK